MNLFNKPVADWTDDEIRVGLQELAKIIQWKDDQHQDTAGLRDRWIALDDERKSRAAMAREVDNATNPVKIRAPVRILRSAAERRAMRRRRRQV